MDRIARTITPVAPFDFELTAGYLTYFQGRYATDSLTDGVYRRLLDLDGKLVLASVSSVGSLEEPALAVELQAEELTTSVAEQVTDKVAWILGVGQDLMPFYALAQSDPAMSATLVICLVAFALLFTWLWALRLRVTGLEEAVERLSYEPGRQES